ncbi:DUF6663 family protein [Halobellus ordinarius]|uniref:DUF6663 family protein n=1 Tax=Halobellus ordinarius TaxID=3075120 RepID=UPI002880B714|nr:DUF6663 family protein [Halobellus sp. ZY16]
MTSTTPTTSGRYRVLGRPRDPAELLLVTVDGSDAGVDGERPGGADSSETDAEEAFAPVYVDTTGYSGGSAETIDDLHAGALVEVTLSWPDGEPRFETVDIVAETTFEFYDGVTGIFEAAKETWMLAEAENEGMNSRVTKSTDGDPNGALYVFAKQSGARDLFEEFRTGVTPLDPLVRRVDDAESLPPEREQPRAVFVLRPADEPFLVVYVVFRRDGMLAETMRSTYGN